MKTTTLLKLATAATLTFGTISSAYAIDKATATEVYKAKKESVIAIKGIIKIDVSMNGKVVQSQEAPLSSNGVIVSKNLALVTYSTIKPKLNLPQQPGLTLDTDLEELKFIDASGEEFDAKIVLHDEDLDIAFLALDPKAENAAEFKAPAIDKVSDVKLSHLDELISISRLDASLRYETMLRTSKVAAVIKKPRQLYLATGAAPGASFFNEKGEFVGITITKQTPGSQKMTPVVLPAKYAYKLIAQAKLKAAELEK